MRTVTSTLLVCSAVLVLAAGCSPSGGGTPPPEPPSEPAAPSAPAAPLPPSEPAAPAAIPAVPADYAQAVFTAWQQGDQARIDELAEPAVAQLLASEAPGTTSDWQGRQCEGAAGSSYCSWVGTASTIVIRVGNEAASQGQPHAVTEVALDTAPSAVALWPYTTTEEAQNSQDQVDQGHSPWQLSPEAVAVSYADAVLSWRNATAQPVQGSDGLFMVTDADPQLGAVRIQLTQPVRTDDTGIWAIVHVGSTSPSAGG